MICAHQTATGHCLVPGPHCGFCAAPTLDGGPCGRDECPGEATRQRASFGSPPPPREPAEWKRRTGLRLERGKVEEIAMDKPSCIALAQHPPTPWRVRAWRRVRERWVGMWARIAQFMGVDLDG